ncbi:hypothetical protein CSW65_00020 [Streptococcus agalactiae]|nr:hypothetical protein CSW65_00020 [Streptococcus agalactiae]
MINNFEYEVLTDEELSSVVGGSTASNIKDGMYIGAIFGGVKGAIAGGVLGWAFTPTKYLSFIDFSKEECIPLFAFFIV